jgi:tetratricopeptide (TPR) repeat protein
VSYSCRADIYYELGKYENAIEDYSEAIELDPENDDYYNDRELH